MFLQCWIRQFLGCTFILHRPQNSAKFINLLFQSDTLNNFLKHEFILTLTCLNCNYIRTNTNSDYILLLAVTNSKTTIIALLNQFG